MRDSFKSILVFSGGLDSTVLLHELVSKNQEVIALSFDYGAKQNKRELEMAKLSCLKLKVEHKIIKLDFIGRLFSSALLEEDKKIPEGSYTDKNLSQTLVPFRNPILMSIAAGYAESIGAKKVFLASHGGDHALYPDCRKDFNQAFAKAVSLGTDAKVELCFPYEGLDKKEIATSGRKLGIDFTKTWSCYKGEDIHCGLCSTCLERAEALERDKGLDPTIYRN